jgi:hypothetical protein
MTNVLYMACNIDTLTEWMYRDYEFYWNKEDAEKHAEFLERCNQLYRDEYDPSFDIFGIGHNTHEARVYSVPYLGTGHPENEATLVRTNAEDNGPLQFTRIVFDDAWEGKMKYWEFFDQFYLNSTSYFKGAVEINESFDAQRYGAIFQREVRRLKNANEYRG